MECQLFYCYFALFIDDDVLALCVFACLAVIRSKSSHPSFQLEQQLCVARLFQTGFPQLPCSNLQCRVNFFFFSLSCSLLVSHVRRLALAALLACVSSLALNPLPMAIRRQPAVAPHSVTSENDTVPRVLSPHRTRPSRDAELVHSGGVDPARFLGPIENCQA